MILVLLPVRNAANDLSGYFQSVARFADGVLALDDGSIDGTAELLSREPLIKGILHNPPRDGFAGWDDAANRNRLLGAAADFAPEWILSLDADERIDEGDARALRSFLQTDAIPGLAYGFRCYPTSDDGLWHLPSPIWIYRLFHYSRGQRFPDQRFHFAPIPTEIPREGYLRTSFRIQHLGGFDNARRAARYEKYRDVDPDRRFWPSYSALLAPVDDELLVPWPVRGVDEPALLWEEPDSPAPGAPLSRAVIVLDDLDSSGALGVTLASLNGGLGESFEIVVVTARDESLGPATVVMTHRAETRAQRLAAGFRATSAEAVIVLDAGQVIEAHDRMAIWRALGEGYGLVRCAIAQPGADTKSAQAAWLRANWPETPGELGTWRPVGYRRDALSELGELPLPPALDRDAEAYLVRALARKGVLVGRVPATVLDRRPFRRETCFAESVKRGRSWAEIDLAMAGPNPVPVVARGARLVEHLRSSDERVPKGALIASACGYAARLAFGQPGDGWTMVGWPRKTLGLVTIGPDGTLTCTIGRVDFAQGCVRSVVLPRSGELESSLAIDADSAHQLRDRLELWTKVPVDDVILVGVESGVASFEDLRGFVGNRANCAATMSKLQMAAALLRLLRLPDSAFSIEALDPALPVGQALTIALELEPAASMRDRLREVTWA